MLFLKSVLKWLPLSTQGVKIPKIPHGAKVKIYLFLDCFLNKACILASDRSSGMYVDTLFKNIDNNYFYFSKARVLITPV